MNIEFNGFDLEQYTELKTQLELADKDPEFTMRANEFLKYGIRIANILRVKNIGYGNAVAATGKAGVYVRMFDKFQRVKNVSQHGDVEELADEKIADTVADLAGYSILWLMIHEKSPVFYNADGSLKFDGDWRQTEWAMKLRQSLGLIILAESVMENELDEIILCQRCEQKSFDIHHKICYTCDGGLQEATIGGTSLTSPIDEDRETGSED